MLPAYFSPSYLGGFPAGLGVYQQLQHLSHGHLDASGAAPLTLPLLPHSLPPQLLFSMTSPGGADLHGSPSSLPLSPSKQPFPPHLSSTGTHDLAMSCPMTSAQMTLSGPVMSGTDASEATMTSYMRTCLATGMQEDTTTTATAAKLVEDRRVPNRVEEHGRDQEDEGRREEEKAEAGAGDRREHHTPTAAEAEDSGLQAERHEALLQQQQQQQRGVSQDKDPPPPQLPRNPQHPTSMACTSSCCQHPSSSSSSSSSAAQQLRWKPSACAVKFSIDSILGLTSAQSSSSSSRREDAAPHRPITSAESCAGSPWSGGRACPYTLCPCVPGSGSSSSSSLRALYLPKASPASLHSPSIPVHTPCGLSRSSHHLQRESPPLRSQHHPPTGQGEEEEEVVVEEEEEEEERKKSVLCGVEGGRGEDREEGGREMGEEEEDEEEEEKKKQSEDQTNFPWLQCTRYHPPKLQRSKKKDGGGKKRKLGRNPRVPFTQQQVAVLEEKFRRTHYLSSMDVAELSSSLTLSETRVKIWFQNRRARERREREASQRAQLLTQKPYQPLSIPSVTWALTSQLSPSPFTQRYRNDLQFRASLFPSSLSAFTSPLPSADVSLGPSASVSCSWPEGHSNSDDENLY